MTREELFAIWAPDDSLWSRWAKAVVFAHWSMAAEPGLPVLSLNLPDSTWFPVSQPMALIVDLPGAMGVAYGLQLAQLGYRPVPLYSAAPWPNRIPTAAYPAISDLVDVRQILAALLLGAPLLSNAKLSPDSPPAFLLDADRRVGYKRPGPGDFDNRSLSLPTDFPSAAMLLRNGISQILVIQAQGVQPQADLIHTLGRWNRQGIKILSRPLDSTGEPTSIRLKAPGPVARFLHGLFATAGLRRNTLGGFGGILPADGEHGGWGAGG